MRRFELVLLALVVAASRASRADEAELLEAPPADATQRMNAPLEKAFEPAAEKPARFPALKNALADLPPFLRDSRLDLHLRSYYFDRLRFDRDENEAWAYGGWLGYQTGWLADVFSLQTTVFTSQKILGLASRDGTLLLQPGQEGYAVLGVANAQLRYADQRFVAWRQEIDLPFVNKRDSRMTPNTFEAYTFDGKLGDFKYVVGQVLQLKERNADVFVPMSEAAGVADSNHGLTLAGFRYSPTKSFDVGAITEFLYDTYNTVYAEGGYSVPLPWSGVGLRADLQLTDQRSVGADLLGGGAFDTQRFGGRVAASYADIVLRAGFSTTSNGRAIQNPFGTDPSFLSMMQDDFKSADEDAWMLGLSYGFRRLGLPDLSTIVYYVSGSGARSDTGVPLPDRREWDLTVDYRYKQGFLRGLWLRFRISFLDEAHAPHTQKEMRAILNYDLPVL
jgi:hypothetical protein